MVIEFVGQESHEPLSGDWTAVCPHAGENGCMPESDEELEGALNCCRELDWCVVTLRYIDTAIWTDPWFEALTPDAKLVFIYSWSNDHMNAAGCTPISPMRVGLEIGISKARVEKTIPTLEPKVIYFADYQILWAVNFLAKQTGAETFLKKVAKDMTKMAPAVSATVLAAYDNLPIPYTPLVNPLDNHTVLSCTVSKGKESPREKPKPEKTAYAEFVTLTEKDYSALVKKYGQANTTRIIDKLNNHKGAKGVTYKSDIHAIRNWVIEAVGATNGQQSKLPQHKEPKKCKGCGYTLFLKEEEKAGLCEKCQEDLEKAKS